MNPAARRGLVRGLVIALLLLVGGVAWFFWTRPSPQPESPAASYAKAFGGPFTLTGTDGKPFSSEQLKGKPFAIFFGFTRCPDVCPTSLSRMAKLRKDLGSEVKDLNIVFVSVDPESDKPSDIGTYLTLFDTPIIGLTGTAEQLAAVKKTYGIFSEKVPLDGGGYTVDHTATIFLMGRDGEFVTTLDVHESDDVCRAKLRRATQA